jgi:hypothetical protein
MLPEEVKKVLGKTPSPLRSADKVNRVIEQIYKTTSQVRAKGVRPSEREKLQSQAIDMQRAVKAYEDLVLGEVSASKAA